MLVEDRHVFGHIYQVVYHNGASHITHVNLEQQMPFYAKSRMVWIKRVLMVGASLVLLTVKSLNTRFREPLRRAMSAALG